MNNRTFAILYTKDNMFDNVKKLCSTLSEFKDNIYIFSYFDVKLSDLAGLVQQDHIISVDKDKYDSTPKFRNFVNKYFKDNKFDGFLHVIDNTTVILKDPKQFIQEIEQTMTVLDYDVWFSTVTDQCNFVYQKYNPRVNVVLDKPEYKKLDIPTNQLFFASNCNTQWIIYNFSTVNDDLLRFDEDFTVDMFYIIEFLVRRAKNKRDNQFFYMHWNMAIPSEYGVFTVIPSENQTNNELMKEENDRFTSKNINIVSVSLDDLMSQIYTHLNQKLAV